jgi:hypothetical protein
MVYGWHWFNQASEQQWSAHVICDTLLLLLQCLPVQLAKCEIPSGTQSHSTHAYAHAVMPLLPWRYVYSCLYGV